MKRIFLVAALCVLASRARAEGLRIGNWPTVMPVSGSVAVTTLPSAGASMSATVAISTASVVVAAANPNRKGLLLYNPSTTTVYIAYDTTASTTHLTYAIAPATTWAMPTPIYLGAVAAVRGSTGDGKLLVTELM